MAGIKSTGYKSKRSDRTLTGATLEMEILSQWGESTMKDFKQSPINHGKGSVAGQLISLEYNRLTVSETVSIDEPTGGYMEMMEYRNSARGYVMALEDEKAMEGYLETMLQGTTLKQKAYGTLASSDIQAETMEQLVSLPWKAVVLRYFEEEMRTTPRIHALVAVPYVRTELQLRFAWCMMGLTREEYDSEERKRSKEEKVFLMTNLRDLIVQEGAAVACAKRRESDKRVEFGLGFSDELLRTSLMAVWELMKPSWCPSPNADSILRATQDVQRELNADCNLRDLNIIYNVMVTASKSNGEDKVELPGWGPEDWVKPGSCLAEVCGLEGHVCGSLDCMKTLEKQHKQLTVLFGNVVMKARTETELIADCHGGTDVNLVTALGFYSMFSSLESLLNLEQKHEMVTAISVEVFPGVLQTEQKYIVNWREAIETEMNIRHSETYCRPSGARYLVGSTLAPMCKSRYLYIS